MGGRYCSLVVGAADDPVPALGLLLLGYPLHAAGRADQPRAEHFGAAAGPGVVRERDPGLDGGTCRPHEVARRIKGKVSFHWIDTADHGYRPLKASGRTAAEVLAEVAAVSAEWVRALPELTPESSRRAMVVPAVVVEDAVPEAIEMSDPVGRVPGAIERVEPQRVGCLGAALRVSARDANRRSDLGDGLPATPLGASAPRSRRTSSSPRAPAASSRRCSSTTTPIEVRPEMDQLKPRPRS